MMDFGRDELEACGLTQEELEERVYILDKHLGSSIVKNIDTEGKLSIDSINRICERSVLLEALSSNVGFNRVKKQIVPNKFSVASLLEPHGVWFQLRVGYILKLVGEQPIFEQGLHEGDNPKDILLRSNSIIIECKSFGIGEAFKRSIGEYLNAGRVPGKNEGAPVGFDRHIGFWGFMPGWPEFHSISINEYQRFITNGIEEKYDQLVEGSCNIIAFNTNEFSVNLDKLIEPLTNLLLSNRYSRLSGFLLLQEEALSQEIYKLRGRLLTTALVKNPDEMSVRVPEDLIGLLTGKHSIALGLSMAGRI